MGDYVGELTTQANFGISTLKGQFCICVKLSSSVSIFYPPPLYFFIPCVPFDQFSCFMVQKTCFRDIYVLLRCEQFFLLIFHYSLFPQCKTLIGHNSGSIKDRAVKFAYSREFTAIADRMVWQPSLSRDRKSPCLPIRVKQHLECV